MGSGSSSAVGENKPQPHARPELLGQKDLGEPDLAQPGARGDDADAAHDVGGTLSRATGSRVVRLPSGTAG